MLGASAMRGVLGKSLTIREARERDWAVGEARGVVTVHPSYLLRIEDALQRETERKRFIAELTRARQLARV